MCMRTRALTCASSACSLSSGRATTRHAGACPSSEPPPLPGPAVSQSIGAAAPPPTPAAEPPACHTSPCMRRGPAASAAASSRPWLLPRTPKGTAGWTAMARARPPPGPMRRRRVAVASWASGPPSSSRANSAVCTPQEVHGRGDAAQAQGGAGQGRQVVVPVRTAGEVWHCCTRWQLGLQWPHKYKTIYRTLCRCGTAPLPQHQS